jgi:hypothetical protein
VLPLFHVNTSVPTNMITVCAGNVRTDNNNWIQITAGVIR